MLFLLLIPVLLCAACAGGNATGAETIEADTVAAPPPDTAELEQLLTAELARLAAEGRQTGGVVWGEDCRALYRTAEYLGGDMPEPPDRLVITWVEQFTGDCDQDGMVTAADLTPIAQHWLERVEYDPPELHDGITWWPAGDPLGDGALNWRLARVDGNHDGLIDIGDITPIAQHWQERLEGYVIYSYDDFQFNVNGADRFFLGWVPRDASLLDSGQGPRIHRMDCEVRIDSLNETLYVENPFWEAIDSIHDFPTVLPANLYLRPLARYYGEFDDWYIGQGSLPLTLENPRPGWHQALMPVREGQSVSTVVLDMALLADGRLAHLLTFGKTDEPPQYGLALHDPAAGTVRYFLWPPSTDFYPRHLAAAEDGTIWVVALDAPHRAESLMVLNIDEDGRQLAGQHLTVEYEYGLSAGPEPQIAALPGGDVLIASRERASPGNLVLRRLDAQGGLLWERAWQQDYISGSGYYGFVEVYSLAVEQAGGVVVGTDYRPYGEQYGYPSLASFYPDGELEWIRICKDLSLHDATEIVLSPGGGIACVLRCDIWGGTYEPSSRVLGITPDGELAWQISPAGRLRLLDAETAGDGTIWAVGGAVVDGQGYDEALLRINTDGSEPTLFRRTYFNGPEVYIGGMIDELEIGDGMFIAYGHPWQYGWRASPLEVLDDDLELTAVACRELEAVTTCEDYQHAATEVVPDPKLEPPAHTVTERIL